MCVSETSFSAYLIARSLVFAKSPPSFTPFASSARKPPRAVETRFSTSSCCTGQFAICAARDSVSISPPPAAMPASCDELMSMVPREIMSRSMAASCSVIVPAFTAASVSMSNVILDFDLSNDTFMIFAASAVPFASSRVAVPTPWRAAIIGAVLTHCCVACCNMNPGDMPSCAKYVAFVANEIAAFVLSDAFRAMRLASSLPSSFASSFLSSP